MPLSNEQLSALEALLQTSPAGANPLPQIRAGFPALSATRCDPEDMRGEAPFGRYGHYDVFLVDTSNHCWRIIDDPRAASGVVITAQR